MKLTPPRILALFAVSLPAHAATISSFHDPDDGSVDSEIENYTFSSSLDGASFDLTLTIEALAGGILATGTNNDLGIADGNLTSSEVLSFELSLSNFVASPTITSISQLQASFTSLRFAAANANGDSGTISSINGIPTSYSWVDGNGGSDFTGHVGTAAEFDLVEVAGGNLVSAFEHLTDGGNYRLDALEFEVISVVATPEPSGLAAAGFLLGTGLLLRQRSR
ncbi:MAG: hypothetical protein ACQKBU_01255 [Verrucomicrobiales bacterium]